MGRMTALRLVDETPEVTNDQVWETWWLDMRAAGCADRTIKERRYFYWSFARTLDHPVIEATRSDLLRFLARDTASGSKLSGKTIQNYKSGLHTLFTILQDSGHRLDNPATRLPRTRIARQEPDPLSTIEVQKILNSGIRTKTQMKLALAACQGFRAVEIAAVSGSSIDWVGQRIRTDEGKGGVVVWRPIHPTVWQLAQAFPREGFWFPGIHGRKSTHIAAKSVSNTLNAAIARAGITGHHAHQLRGWYAQELLESGADMLTIQHAMRHASPATLARYIRPSMGKIQTAAEQLPALDVPMLRVASIKDLADARHGSTTGYSAGCRCASCVEAKRADWAGYQARRRRGEG